jgi:hypothetical protein
MSAELLSVPFLIISSGVYLVNLISTKGYAMYRFSYCDAKINFLYFLEQPSNTYCILNNILKYYIFYVK